MIEAYKAFLEWEYSHETVDEIHSSKIIQVKRGGDYLAGSQWDNTRTIDLNDNTEKVKNTGKDLDSEWVEEWEQKQNESWAKKEGHQGNQHWNE